MDTKTATPDHPIQELLTKRWSPYAFSDRPVDPADLRSLFEAARWAPSSYNEQPWRYVVARKEDRAAFDLMLSCLVEGNQAWAQAAPVLAIAIASLRFARNDKPNKAAHHDLGLAAGNLGVEATARGLSLHQMIGIEPERVREIYRVPDGYEPLTGLAIGYAASAENAPEALRERDLRIRERRPLEDFVFSDAWGESASWSK